jgi:hypothetical protein
LNWIINIITITVIIIIIIIIIIMYFILSPINANFNLLPLYSPLYFVFCSFNYFCVFLCTHANFIIGFGAVKFARK